jgi:hypothetical protein
VGSRDLASYLITTSRGNILINSDLEGNVPLLKASIEKLGYKFSVDLVNQPRDTGAMMLGALLSRN